GNVDTRLRKLDAGEADATILAFAGLARLGLAARVTRPLGPAGLFPGAAPVTGPRGPDGCLPAAGQGAIAITARSGDAVTRALLARFDHRPTSLALATQSDFLTALDAPAAH